MQVSEGSSAEDAPQQRDNHKCLGDVHSFDDGFPGTACDFVENMDVAQSSFQNQQHAVGKAPDHEGPVGAVPDAAYGEHDEGVERPAGYGHTIASQRNV